MSRPLRTVSGVGKGKKNAMSDVFAEIVNTPGGMMLPRIVAELSSEQLKNISNGCGPESMKRKLVPDSILGVDFYPACCGHDACYHFGETEKHKRIADRCFLYNLLLAVDEHCVLNGIIEHVQRVACRSAAFEYYKFVASWGDDAFWAHKNKEQAK